MSFHSIEIKDASIENEDTLLFTLPHSLGSVRWVGVNAGSEVINQPYLLLNKACTINYSASCKALGSSSFEGVSQPARGEICDVIADTSIYFTPDRNSVYTPYGGASLKENNDATIVSYLTVWHETLNEGAFCEFRIVYSVLDGTRKRVTLVGNSYSLS